MDVVDSLSFGDTPQDENKTAKKEMPRKIVRKDFKLNEIKINKNPRADGRANSGSNRQQIRIFNPSNMDSVLMTHCSGQQQDASRITSSASKMNTPGEHREPHKKRTQTTAVRDRFNTKRYTQNPVIISMNCSKAMTMTNYNELAALVENHKVASGHGTRNLT